jgi:phage terminase large subunit GpA-like protein
VLGETWAETGEAPDWLRLFERREDWRIGTVPPGGLFLTAGADVQKDRTEVSVWAWGRGLESWLVDHTVIDGGPESSEAWAALTAVLGTTWPHAGGTEIGLGRLAIDTGYEAPAVYAWARRMGSGQVVAVKGIDGFSRPAPVIGPSYVDATEGGKKIRRGAKLWTIAVATFKSETYRFLRLAAPTEEDRGERHRAGFIHLPRGVDAEWVKQLVAEQLVTVKTRRGFTRLEWQKLRERNEVLDCRVYARAAAWIAGLDRWSERKWRELEKQLGIAAEATTPTPMPAIVGQKTRADPPSGRRALRSRWLGGRPRNWLQRQ